MSWARRKYHTALKVRTADINSEESRSLTNLLESLTGKKLVEDKNLSKIQDQLGGDISGVFGKGGLGHGLGAGLSKNL